MVYLMKRDADMSDEEVTVDYFLKEVCIIGGVEEVTRRLGELWNETGGFGTLLMITHDWDDKARWLRCMELLAEEIVPKLPSYEEVRVGD